MIITKTNSYLSLVNEFIIDSPAPMNINYFYNLGSLLGLNLVILIITGVTLAMHYVSDISMAFQASEHNNMFKKLLYLLRISLKLLKILISIPIG